MTWPEAFTRRLEDGTAWTEGWTEQEVNLPLRESEMNETVPPETIEDVTDEERHFGFALRFGNDRTVVLYQAGANPTDRTFHYHTHLPYDKEKLRKLAEVLLRWRAGEDH